MKSTVLKRELFFAWMLFSIIFSSCDEIKDSVSVDIPIKPAPIEFRLQHMEPRAASDRGAANTGDIILFQKELDIDLKSILSGKNSSLEHLKEFNFKKAEIKAVEPSGFDMSRFVGLKLYFGETPSLVAEAADVSSDKKILKLKVSQANLMKYADEDELKIMIKGPGSLMEFHHVLLSMQLEFSAKVKP